MSEAENRASVPFTNAHFAAYLESMLGRPYWYGTCVYKCTESLLAKKAKQYPSHYQSGRTSTYKRHIAAKEISADCMGLAKGYAWTSGGVGVAEAIGSDRTISQKYGANGCPDKGTSGMLAYAKSKGMPWGVIGTMPEIIGLAVTFSGHVGFYVGNGYVIESKGFQYGCVRTLLTDGKWTHWYMLPFIDYGDDAQRAPQAVQSVRTLGERLLQRGSAGEDVAELQRLLIGMEYDLGTYGAGKDGVDGSYGEKTERAVRRFQTFAQIEADGKYGSITHKALMGVLDEREKGEQDAPEQEDAQEDVERLCIQVIADKVNIRTGPSTAYKIITRVNTGNVLDYAATYAHGGWHAVLIGGKTGWISAEYANLCGCDAQNAG